jgi:hypothetical protein
MPDEDWWRAQTRRYGVDVVDVVLERARSERLGQTAGPVATKTHGDSVVAAIGEEIQEMVIPHSCGTASSVDEKQWEWMRARSRTLLDHF